MAKTLNNLTLLLSQSHAGTLGLEQEEVGWVDPKFTMVARLFVKMLKDEAVVPRLQAAQSVDDLKAILFADDCLSRARNVYLRHHLLELLADPEADTAVIVERIALHHARNVYFDVAPPDDGVNPARTLHTVEAAAERLGVETDSLYQSILDGRARAVLCLTQAEVERLAVRQGMSDER
jgi:hypothetical protein